MGITTGLICHFILDSDTIDKIVSRTSAGAYDLGHALGADGSMPVRYVGRADYDVSDRLKQWARSGSYRYFAYIYCASPIAAYRKECDLYHVFHGELGRLDNKNHPQKPSLHVRCAICGL